ncbi:hypothetical protein [Merdibacter massiliensis]|uniref:hypothetical protein n=1 Tax=Merdibacter massiliensis TaxID=1871030 RepID=UPI0012B6511D|nr:hypothetical protein [Merdibacter massiliensis]
MITIKIEYFSEEDREKLIAYLRERYVLVDIGKVKNSPKAGSKKKIQFIEMIAKK